MEDPFGAASCPFVVLSPRLVPGLFGVQRDESVDTGIAPCDAGDLGINEFERGQRARVEQPLVFEGRQMAEIGHARCLMSRRRKA